MSDSRDAAVDRMKAKLDELNADLDRWEAKADQAKAEGRAEYLERVEALRQQRDELEQKITDAKEAGGDAWEEIVQGFDDAWTSLKDSFKRARSELD